MRENWNIVMDIGRNFDLNSHLSLEFGPPTCNCLLQSSGPPSHSTCFGIPKVINIPTSPAFRLSQFKCFVHSVGPIKSKYHSLGGVGDSQKTTLYPHILRNSHQDSLITKQEQLLGLGNILFAY